MSHANRILSIALALGLAAAMPALAADAPPKDAKAATKVSEDAARKTALASVSNATVQNAKLVNAKGYQVWSLDLKSAGSGKVINVQVDADSGRIVGKSVQRQAQAAKPDKAK